MSSYLFLLLVLACPLAMIFMMRGMHGGRGDDADAGETHVHQMSEWGQPHGDSGDSLDTLRRRRDELEREIEEREAEEEMPTPVGGDWR